MQEVRSPLQGTIVSLEVAAGDVVGAGAVLLLIESMKMHHDVVADEGGRVGEILVDVGTAVMPGDALVRLEPVGADEVATAGGAAAAPQGVAPGGVRADLAEILERHRVGLDEARPDAVAKRRARQRRTARENVDDLVDDGSFVEYGAGRDRRPAAPARARRPHRQHAGGRPGRWHRHRERRSVRTAALAYHRRALRLHRARRHAGHAEPPQEGPPVRARPAAAAPDRVLHRGRRRAPGRHRRDRRVGAGDDGVPATSPSSPASCRSSASTPATASPGTRRSSAAATS